MRNDSSKRPSSAHHVPGWTTWLGLALFALALWWLHHVLGQYRWQDIVVRLRAIPVGAIATAALFAMAGYACLTLYELLGVRFAGAKMPYYKIALISFMAYAVGHNVGLNAVSGGAIRFRAYTGQGLRPKQIATVVAFGSITFALGAAFLLGLSLIANGELSGMLLHLDPRLVIAGGALLLTGVLVYFVLAFMRRESLEIGPFTVPVLRPHVAFAQIGVACADLLCTAAALYVLLPRDSAVGFTAFAGLYLIAMTAGVASSVPGGVGVFESVLFLLLPAVPPDRLLGSLLAYRAIYYLVPFTVALAMLGAHELWVHRGPMERMLRLAHTWLIAVVPQAAAIAVFGAGAVLLFSGATPGFVQQLTMLRHFVPLPVLELSHLLGSAVGVALLVIAHGLYRRLNGAWWLTLWLLGAGIVLSLLKGFDYADALVLSAVAGILVLAHGRFPRRASLLDQRFSARWVAALMVVLATTAWLVVFSFRHVPYANDLWWEFAFKAQAPRSLRASLLAVILAAVYGLWRLLRPAVPLISAPTETDYAQVERILERASDTTANLALLGDKCLLFDDAASAFIMYQISGGSWVAMGDPVGPWEAREPLAWRFVERCDDMAVSPVFYQVTPENLAIYIDLGLRLSKLGEEALVDLEAFSLEGGGARADLRQAHRRAGREGAVFRLVPRAEVGAIMPRLREVSDVWLGDKSGEKGFSLGYFDERYLERFDCAVVEFEQRIVAFANLWRTGDRSELSVDLMRFSAAAPKSVIDFLLIECMLWGKRAGYRRFNLGMAPLSGLEEHPLAPAWHKLGRLVQRYGEDFYHFEGLRKFKEKFEPTWRPRYLAAPGGLSMAGALLDVTNLISGGPRRIATK
ncbi:MAG: bifunctional lysylphosphatidylglycerol flippase/synthetase MprF [Gammaproteobacteria bacterium]|nr:bifunctional lysylphosphatidylglycerol flippase/synthetase MprF [Gammaproteobacteria bacterium]